MCFKNCHCTTIEQKIARFLFFSGTLLCLLFMHNFNTVVTVKYLCSLSDIVDIFIFQDTEQQTLHFVQNCNYQHEFDTSSKPQTLAICLQPVLQLASHDKLQ